MIYIHHGPSRGHPIQIQGFVEKLIMILVQTALDNGVSLDFLSETCHYCLENDDTHPLLADKIDVSNEVCG